MSICPSKDIHSIYLDNELPPAYIPEYEAHIQHCAKCAAELAKLRKIHEMLHTDAVSWTTDSHYLDESFERLKTRMSYHKVTKKITPFPANTLKWVIPAAAAAVIFAIVLPVRFESIGSSTETASALVTPIARRKNVSLAKNNSGVVIKGNIPATEVLSAFKKTQTVQASDASYGSDFELPPPPPLLQNDMNDVDVFRPDFGENQAISIKINIPGLTAAPVTAEIKLPVNAALAAGMLK